MELLLTRLEAEVRIAKTLDSHWADTAATAASKQASKHTTTAATAIAAAAAAV